MILVGIDVAKDKHDCFIMNSDGEILAKAFTFLNNKEGFNFLYEKICTVSNASDKIKVGLEATGHYSYNLLGFLLDKGLPTFVINPLHTNLYRKSLSLSLKAQFCAAGTAVNPRSLPISPWKCLLVLFNGNRCLV